MLKPSIQVHDVDGLMVVEFWDCLRLDAGAVQAVRSSYEQHLQRGGRPELVVDLLGVGFAGSATLGHFVSLLRSARPHGGRLIFCNVDPTVFEVFRATKLVPMFRFVADRDAAIADATRPASGPPASTEKGPSQPPTSGPPPKSDGDGLLRSGRRRKLS